MAVQLQLFGAVSPRAVVAPLPPHNGTPTSVAAAVSMRPTAGTLRALVLDFICSRGPRGATRTEIEEALSLSGNTVRPRVKELQACGLVRDTSDTRLTPSGRKASVLVACGTPQRTGGHPVEDLPCAPNATP